VTILSDPHIGEWLGALVATFAIFGIMLVVGAVGAYLVIRFWGERIDSETGPVVEQGIAEPSPRLSA
jgi:hypothetical protein